MRVPAKTDQEIEAMREGGKILATIYEGLRSQAVPGVTERMLNNWVAREITSLGATATYQEPEVNFPGVICISTNDEIVHSVPSERVLKIGDIVGFDLVISHKGMKTDSAFTMMIGNTPTGDAKRLIDATEKSLYAGIDAIKGETRVGDIAEAVEAVLLKAKLGIVRELVGHGIGHEMHMPPDVPNYGRKGTGPLLVPGDTIAIEPMAMLGQETISVDSADGWTIRTKDGSSAAHFEHTVLITDNGCEILTQL